MQTDRRVKRVIPAAHRSWLTRRQRHMLGLVVTFFQLSLVCLAVFPVHSVRIPEVITVIGGVVVTLGIFTHVSLAVRLPGDRWAYLACVLLDFYVWGWFMYVNYSSSVIAAYLPVSMLLFAVTQLSVLAHMLDGGARAPRDEP